MTIRAYTHLSALPRATDTFVMYNAMHALCARYASCFACARCFVQQDKLTHDVSAVVVPAGSGSSVQPSADAPMINPGYGAVVARRSDSRPPARSDANK